MERFGAFSRMTPFLAVALAVMILPVHGQINTACTTSVLATFTPCMNFLTNSTSANGTAPTADCCGSLKNLTSNGRDCFCLIVTGNIPFSIPINRTLAISLPRACNMPGVPSSVPSHRCTASCSRSCHPWPQLFHLESLHLLVLKLLLFRSQHHPLSRQYRIRHLS
ncbi:hypothetical protein OIU78_004560 [Salix suchowensis]|nr:hypothetical protein OIU78_004560 [Salix suchowensis]